MLLWSDLIWKQKWFVNVNVGRYIGGGKAAGRHVLLLVRQLPAVHLVPGDEARDGTAAAEHQRVGRHVADGHVVGRDVGEDAVGEEAERRLGRVGVRLGRRVGRVALGGAQALGDAGQVVRLFGIKENRQHKSLVNEAC